MENNFILTIEAQTVIDALRHPAGTYTFYRATLDRLFNCILHASDMLGMDETETVSTLRTIDLLRSDLAVIAGQSAEPDAEAADTEESDMVELPELCN